MKIKTISKIIPFKGDYEKIVVDGCFQYTDNESELIISFANSVKPLKVEVMRMVSSKQCLKQLMIILRNIS